jgi:hypothetical protein
VEHQQSKLPVYLFVVFIGVVACGIGYGFYAKILPMWRLEKEIEQTQELVDSEAKKLIKNWKSLRAEDMKIVIGETPGFVTSDVWDQSLHYDVSVEPKLITALVVSEGPDGKLNTEDDIVGTATDVNKSRIVGEWIGSKTKEGLKGIWDGLKKKTTFKKEKSDE